MNKIPFYMLIVILMSLLSTGTVWAEGSGGTIPPILPIAEPPANWESGTEPWVLDGSTRLPDTDPFGTNASYMVSVNGKDSFVDTWGEVIELTLNGAMPSSIWRIKQTQTEITTLYLPFISK